MLLVAADAWFLLRRRSNFEQEGFVERTRQKLHGDWRLVGLGTFQTAAVGIVRRARGRTLVA
jgi:hypothetical protein